MTDVRKKIEFVAAMLGALILFTGSIAGAVSYLQQYAKTSELKKYAKIEQLKQVEMDVGFLSMRLEQKIVADRIKQRTDRMYQLIDRNKGPDCNNWKNQDNKNEYRRILKELKDLNKEYDRLIRKKPA